MLVLKLWNYIRGYVIIIVEGYFLEKFMNICTHRQIFMWDVKRKKDCLMTLKVSIKGFKLLRPVARKTRCRVRIAGKRGIPFIFSRYKRRKTFVAGAVLFILLIYIMTSFIWMVEVTGNDKIAADVIIKQLTDLGIGVGTWKFGIDTQKAVNELMLGNEQLAWLSMEIKGTKLKVQVSERVKPPELVPKNEPCDIVASRDGVIKRVIANEGLEMVKEGDTVVKGQILISGRIPKLNEPEKIRLVHSLGVVEARTWYEGESPVTVNSFIRERTGKEADSYSLLLFGRKLHIYSGRAGFTDYDKIEIEKQLSIGRDFVFPFGISIDRCYEVITKEHESDEETARKEALEEAKREAMGTIPPDAEIAGTDEDFVQGEDGLAARVIIECIEKIGVNRGMGGE